LVVVVVGGVVARWLLVDLGAEIPHGALGDYLEASDRA
jgi:hypothetical protein